MSLRAHPPHDGLFMRGLAHPFSGPGIFAPHCRFAPRSAEGSCARSLRSLASPVYAPAADRGRGVAVPSCACALFFRGPGFCSARSLRSLAPLHTPAASWVSVLLRSFAALTRSAVHAPAARPSMYRPSRCAHTIPPRSGCAAQCRCLSSLLSLRGCACWGSQARPITVKGKAARHPLAWNGDSPHLQAFGQ